MATSATVCPDQAEYRRTIMDSVAVGLGNEAVSSQTITGTPADSRNLLYKRRVVTFETESGTRTIYATESGTVFVMGNGAQTNPVTFALPAAYPGLWFTFIDMDPDAAGDLIIQAATGDTVGGSVASGTLTSSGDAIGETVTIVAVDESDWVVISSIGTWTPSS